MKSITDLASEKKKEIDVLCTRHSIRILALFGSSLSGTPRDVDLAIFPVLDVNADDLDKLQIISDFESLFQIKTDIVIAHSGISTTLLFEICKNSLLLYEDEDGSFEDERSLAFRKYADTAKLRKLRDENIKEFARRL
jgi:predicted nucleotidyltransferase